MDNFVERQKGVFAMKPPPCGADEGMKKGRGGRRRFISRHSRRLLCENAAEFHGLEKDRRVTALREALKGGASIRQVSRPTGVGIGAIRMHAKN